MLQRSGWQAGRDRVERIWRREGLKVPQKQRPRKRLWLNDGSCIRLRPERVLLQGSVVEGGGLPTKGRLRSSVQLHQRASVRYVACLIHV